MAEELVIPTVTWDQIQAFHAAHFSSPSTASAFFANFIPKSDGGPELQTSAYTAGHTAGLNSEATELIHEDVVMEEEGEVIVEYEEIVEEEEEEEEDLGFYPDGVRRTLTDAQIAIFRHSEIQELLKAQRKKLEAERAKSPIHEFDEGEETITPPPQAPTPSSTSSSIPQKRPAPATSSGDYDLRHRPTPSSRPAINDSASLPWDDEDVGDWNTKQSNADSASCAPPPPPPPIVSPTTGFDGDEEIVVAPPPKPKTFKPTYDAPSGMQFFWPAIEKS